jgi:hypothetical protein
MIDPALLDSVSIRLEELERRVALLESGHTAQDPEPAETIPSPMLTATPTPQGSGFFSTMGRAMLGIAGAYLLRATAESRWIPEAVLAPFAIAYALAWLVAAARTTRSLTRVTYACTSVLILAPMLWELTTSFHVLPAWADALALAAMATLAFVLGRSAESIAVLRISTLAVAGMSLALAIVTHENLPFIAVLLLLVLSSESVQTARRLTTTRALVALAADLGVWILIYIYRGPHPDYPQISATGLIAPAFVLFGIAAGTGAFAAGVRKERITVFATVQTVVAFLLVACALLYFGPVGRFAILGAVCLLLAAVVYAALLTVLRKEADERNHAVFATWSAALLLAGCFLCIPAQWRSGWLGLSAITATAISVRTNQFFLAVHGNAFLLASAIVSGLGIYAWQALADVPAMAPGIAVWFALMCACACYVLVRRGGNNFAQPVSYISVAVAAVATAALMAHGFIALAALGFALGPQHLALIRSFTLCALALGLATIAATAHRRELTHIAYAAVALEAIKLVLEDLRHGHLAYVAASVCLFAITLIALPRVTRKLTTQS